MILHYKYSIEADECDIGVSQDVFGRHLWDIPAIKVTPEIGHVRLFFQRTLLSLTLSPQISLAVSVTYPPAVFLVKLSAFLLLYQLFGVNKRLRLLIYFGVISQAILYLTFLGIYIGAEAVCVDAANLKTSYCAHLWISTIIQGVINVVTDSYVLALPVAMVLGLQMTPKRKVGISAIFLTGLL